jgi:hypothetical protein
MPPPRFDLIAVDLDGTLFGPDGRVSAANVEAVRAARAAGIEVVICTGRAMIESGTAIRAIDADQPAKGRTIAPIVCAGGAMVCDAASGRTLHRWPMDAGLVSRLCGHFAGLRRAPLVLKDRDAAGFDYLVVNSGPIEGPIQWWFGAMPVEVRFIDDIAHDAHPEHTVRVGFAALAEVMLELARGVHETFGHETLTQHFAAVAGVHPGQPHGVRDGRVHLLEVFDRQVNKWTAVHRLAVEQGIPRERVVAIGDEVNDVAMIEGAGLGIAMENAVPAVKKAARIETKSHAEDGVAWAIRKILSGEW